MHTGDLVETVFRHDIHYETRDVVLKRESTHSILLLKNVYYRRAGPPNEHRIDNSWLKTLRRSNTAFSNGILVYVVRPFGLQNSLAGPAWVSDMNRLHQTFCEIKKIQEGLITLVGVTGQDLRFQFSHHWLVPIIKMDGALDNSLRNRCFVCNTPIPTQENCTTCIFCSATKVM